jgi:cytochrome d ubiquinol oxidase subunit I
MTIWDAVVLARVQFALNMSFHILFPAISIGLAWVLLFFRFRYTTTKAETWEYAYYFWVKIFALTFALGVVSGVTMSFQFGTNWPAYAVRIVAYERVSNRRGQRLAGSASR